MNQSDLMRNLDTVVDDFVNSVGVDLNSASVALLARVSGLSNAVAKSVLRWRDVISVFTCSAGLLKVTGLGTTQLRLGHHLQRGLNCFAG